MEKEKLKKCLNIVIERSYTDDCLIEIIIDSCNYFLDVTHAGVYYENGPVNIVVDRQRNKMTAKSLLEVLESASSDTVSFIYKNCEYDVKSISQGGLISDVNIVLEKKINETTK